MRRASARRPLLHAVAPGLAALGLAAGLVALDAPAPVELVVTQEPEAPELTAGELTILEDGITTDVLSVTPLDPEREPWDLVLYFDLPSAKPASVRSAAAELGRIAGDLTRWAEISIVEADPAPAWTLRRTRDAEEVSATLAALARRADEAGELWRARDALRAELEGVRAGEEGDAARRQRVTEWFFGELELRQWQQNAFEEALLADPEATADRPRATVLVRDLPSSGPAERAREALRPTRPSPLMAQRLERGDGESGDREVAMLAALGIRFFPTLLGTGDGSPGRAELVALGRDSGGAAIGAAGEIRSALQRLGQAFRIVYRPTATAHHPFDDRGQVAAGDEPGAERAALRALTVRRRSAAAVHAATLRSVEPPELVTRARARALAENEVVGTLPVTAALVGWTAGAATLEIAVEPAAAAGAGTAGSTDTLRVTYVEERLDRRPATRVFRGRGEETAGRRFLLRAQIRPEDDALSSIVVVEDLATGAWGAAEVDESDTSLARAGDLVEDVASPLPVTVSGERRRESDDGSLSIDPMHPDPATETRTPLKALVLVPPREPVLTGEQKFETLLSLGGVARVDFLLDGRVVAEDRKAPFEATIDLGARRRPMVVAARAYSRNDLFLGADDLHINRALGSRGVRITELATVDGGELEVAAAVELAEDQSLQRVEIYRGADLQATLLREPFRARIGGRPLPGADFVRVVARLGDGTFLEDVRFVGDSSFEERVEVNLVQVAAIVTDRDGEILEDLDPSAFTLKRGRQSLPFDRFSRAEEVPLEMALVVDTSESMWPVMTETRRAAARFLTDVLTRIDRAFLVDFDDRPRLAHPSTGEVFDLIGALGRLQPSGATALYDSILYAMVELVDRPGRKAVVLLTDGDDYNSRFGYRRVYRTAAAAGVPLYFLALGGFDEERPSFRKSDLEGFAAATGGRVFYVNSMSEVTAAYDRISRELRSQYLLGWTLDRELSPDELEEFTVEVDRPGARVRVTVGQGG